VGKVARRLAGRGLTLVLDQPAKDFLIEKGYNPDFGARPLRRAVGTYVEDPLSEMLLSGECGDDTLIHVSRKEDQEHLVFTHEAGQKTEPVETEAQST
jgi:ATP-dependent Clp protease ATP-binding subunit ClpC